MEISRKKKIETIRTSRAKVDSLVPEGAPCYLVVGPHAWGRSDESFAIARTKAQENGLNLKDGYLVYTFPAEVDPTSLYVDDWGGVNWRYTEGADIPENIHDRPGPTGKWLVVGAAVRD